MSGEISPWTSRRQLLQSGAASGFIPSEALQRFFQDEEDGGWDEPPYFLEATPLVAGPNRAHFELTITGNNVDLGEYGQIGPVILSTEEMDAYIIRMTPLPPPDDIDLLTEIGGTVTIAAVDALNPTPIEIGPTIEIIQAIREYRDDHGQEAVNYVEFSADPGSLSSYTIRYLIELESETPVDYWGTTQGDLQIGYEHRPPDDPTSTLQYQPYLFFHFATADYCDQSRDEDETDHDPAGVQVIECGETKQGEITEDDVSYSPCGQDVRGAYYQPIAFSGSAGWDVSITMERLSDYDEWSNLDLRLLNPAGEEIASTTPSSENPGENPVQLSASIEQDGEYTIQAGSHCRSSSRTFPYELTLECDQDGSSTGQAQRYSFENASLGEYPDSPWYVQNDSGSDAGIEVSDDFASDGDQSLHMWSHRNDLAISRVAIDLDLTDISSMMYDAYNEASNANWGDIKINLDGIPGVSSDTEGEPLDNTLVDGFPPEDQWYHDIEVDLSPYTGEHTIILWVRGNGNDVYWDNIRFQNE